MRVGAGKGQANGPYKNHGRKKTDWKKKSIFSHKKTNWREKLNVYRLSAAEISIEEQETERDSVK